MKKNVRYAMMIVSILLFAIPQLFAQKDATIKDEMPNWVKMMEDPNVNYNNAIKAYESYWKGKEKPEWEDPMMEYYEGKITLKQAQREQKKRAREIKEMNQQERLKYDQLAYHCKRFEQWKREVAPYVQEDGSILTEEDKLAIWKKQQEEMKQPKKEN
jgi:competence protein ComGC